MVFDSHVCIVTRVGREEVLEQGFERGAAYHLNLSQQGHGVGMVGLNRQGLLQPRCCLSWLLCPQKLLGFEQQIVGVLRACMREGPLRSGSQ